VASRWLTPAALASALVLAVGVAAAGTDARPAGPTAGDRVGISTNTIWLPAAEGFSYLLRARLAGIGWVREDFAWSVIEPARGVFAWGRTDTLMRNASTLGLKVLAIATYAPSWASGHPESDKYAPRDPRDYAAFVGAVADRYGRGGTFWRAHPRLVPSPLTAIELWNEPWLTEFWQSGPDPAAYARLVRAAATTVKARHPQLTVLASGDLSEHAGGTGAAWLAPLLAADPALWRSRLVDAWSVHLYCQQLSPLDATAPQDGRFDRLLLTRALTQQAGAPKPIWITEFGWNTTPGTPAAVSEDTQAQYVRDALQRALTEWASFVPRSFVFTWTKPASGDRYNLVRPDGSARPAWQAIGSLVSAG
jgi:hypothetical protein